MNHRPKANQLFRHTDGGYYRFVAMARHTEDQSPLVIYEHVWPFDTAGDPWARPAVEWDSRFTPVSEIELEGAMQADQSLAQAAIIAAKSARRAAEGR